MGEYRLPWEPPPKPPKPINSPAKPGGPKPGDKDFIGPISVQQKANKAWSDSWIARGKWAIANPELSGYVAPKPNVPQNQGGTQEKIKVVNPSNYIENSTQTDPDYAAEATVEFNNLTTVEILEISRNSNMRIDSRNLNPNILDIVDVANTFSPTEIIKLQKTNEDYFTPFQENLEENLLEITTIPGVAQVTVPQQDNNNILRAQVEILVPKRIHRDTIYI